MRKVPGFRIVLIVLMVLTPKILLAQGVSSMGTDFWVGFMPNYLYPAENVRLFIASPSDNLVHVDIYYGDTTPVQRILVPMKADTPVTIKTTNTAVWETRITENVDYKSVHIYSRSPISVDGFSNETATSDGYLALPRQVLGTDYYAICYYDDKYGVGLDDPLAGEFLIVTPYDSTTITITTTADTRSDASGTLSHPKGSTWSVTLQKGQTYLVQSTGLHIGEQDLTGSHIRGSKPFVLLSGHQRATVPIGYSGNSKNHMIEMIPPVSFWGTRYYDIPSAGRTLSGDMVRLIAGEKDVQVIDSKGNTYLLQEPGSFVDVDTVTEPTEFSSNGKKFLAMMYSYSQGYKGDPAGTDPYTITLPAVERFARSAYFRTPGNQTGEPDYKNYATFIAPYDSLSSIMVNGLPLSTYNATLLHIVGSSTMGAARLILPSNKSYRCTSATPFGCYQNGQTSVDGYGWPASSSFNVASSDVLAPLARNVTKDSISYLVTVTDRRPKDIGLSQVNMVQDSFDVRFARPSQNIQFQSVQTLVPGDTAYTFSLTMIDSTKPAFAAIWAVDRAGNEAIFSYDFRAHPLKVDTTHHDTTHHHDSTAFVRMKETLTGLRLTPNPASNELTIEYNSPSGSPAKLEIYDMNGRKVVVQADRSISSNVTVRSTLDISRLPNGSYLLELRLPDLVRTGKFEVRR